MNSFGISNAISNAKKIFRIPQCGKKFPKEYKKSRPCLNYSIGQCSAPCAGKITAEAHNEAVERALDFIVNGSGPVVEELTAKMNAAAENLEYEKAVKLRDIINSIKKVTDKQKVVAAAVEEQDVFAVVGASQGNTSKACLSVLRFKESRLYESEHFIIDLPEDLPQARNELLRSYYSMRDFVPGRVTLDGNIEDASLMEEWLTSLAGRRVHIVIPRRGEQYSLVEMCRSNAAQKLAIYMGVAGKSTAALDELGKLLGLKAPPSYIESYDISHTAGTNNVAGMVVFKDGLPFKKAYKRFAVKSFSGQDDYGSMAEVLDRRLTEYENAEDKTEGFGRLPDLILLDGGKGQVNAVIPVLEAHGIDVPVFGMVKDNHHRTRAIATSGDELVLTSKRAAFALVGSIQEEVHRYSVAYHHSKNKKSALATSLKTIDGIGDGRAKALLRQFKTMQAISQATEEELMKVKGMSRNAAREVYSAFHSE